MCQDIFKIPEGQNCSSVTKNQFRSNSLFFFYYSRDRRNKYEEKNVLVSAKDLIVKVFSFCLFYILFFPLQPGIVKDFFRVLNQKEIRKKKNERQLGCCQKWNFINFFLIYFILFHFFYFFVIFKTFVIPSFVATLNQIIEFDLDYFVCIGMYLVSLIYLLIFALFPFDFLFDRDRYADMR